MRAPHRIDRTPATALVRDWEIRNPLELFAQARAYLFDKALAFAEDVLAVLDRQHILRLAIDVALVGAIAATEKARVPTALLMPNIYMFPAPGLPAFGPGFQPARGPLGRFRDAALGTLFARLLATGLPALNAARAQLGLDPLRPPSSRSIARIGCS